MRPEFDIASITDPFCRERKSNFGGWLKSFRQFITKDKHFMTPKDYDRNQLLALPRTRMTNGPNGQVTLESAHTEAQLLMKVPPLREAYRGLCAITGNKLLADYVDALSKAPLTEREGKAKYTNLGKIAQVPDQLNKNRVVAMVDYWTNVLLAPIEELIRHILKSEFFHTDFLRNHSEGVAKIRTMKRT